MTDLEREHQALLRMALHGGNFVKLLAAAWLAADVSNAAKLRGSFGYLLEKYSRAPLPVNAEKDRRGDKLVPLVEASAILCRSASFVRKLVRESKINFVQDRPHAKVFFWKKDLMEFLDRQVKRVPGRYQPKDLLNSLGDEFLEV